MNTTTENIKKLWAENEEFWIDELCRFHPANSGIGLTKSSTVFEFGSGFKKGKEMAEWVHKKILGFVNDNIFLLKSIICDDLDYCETIKPKVLDKEGWKVALSVSDSLASYAIGIPIPIGHLSVYLLRYHVLDKVCSCQS